MAKQTPQQNGSPAAAAPRPDPRSRVLRWAAGAALLGVFMIYNSVDPSADTGPDSSPQAGVTAPAAPPTASGPTAPSALPPATGPSLPRSRPTRLTIPNLAVSAPFTPLTIGSSGKLNAPPANNNNLVGWYADGPTPGERGNAIVAGHVDTKTGPAVFLLLDLLKPGNTVDITRADGLIATFTVDSVKTFSKAAFPDQEVYGETPNAQLRLITCGGAYDHKAKDYTDNVVVFAHFVSSRRG